MQKKMTAVVMFLFFLSFLLPSCATMDDRTKTITQGAGAGLAIGGIFGYILGEEKGAAIGAGIGAGAGAVVGTAVANQKQRFINTENSLDYSISSVNSKNNSLKRFNKSMSAKVQKEQAATQKLISQYHSTGGNQQALSRKRKKIQSMMGSVQTNISEAQQELYSLRGALGQAQGNKSATLQKQINERESRLSELNQNYAALSSIDQSLANVVR